MRYPAPTPISGTATCVNECGGDYCTNNTGNPIGYCSCSIANSPHCTTEASWVHGGHVLEGVSDQNIVPPIAHSQIRACTATSPPTGNGGGRTPVSGAPVPLNPTSNLSCPTTNPTNVLFQWSSVSGTNNYHSKSIILVMAGQGARVQMRGTIV